MIVYINGQYKLIHKAHISIMDHGFLYGDGVYETLRVRKGKIFLLRDHLNRLLMSAKQISLFIPWSGREIERILYGVIKINNHKEAVIRMTLSRGVGPYGFDPRLCRKPTFVVTSQSYQAYPSSFFKKGIPLAVVTVRRNSPRSLPPSAKTSNCLNGILAKIESLKMGGKEALLLALDGSVAEGSVSNVFLVKRGRLLTPKRSGNMLPGVTQNYVMQLARGLGIPVQERRINLRDLKGANEVFLTNTTMDIMPVSKILWANSKKGKGKASLYKVGELTRKLMANFENKLSFRDNFRQRSQGKR